MRKKRKASVIPHEIRYIEHTSGQHFMSAISQNSETKITTHAIQRSRT